MNKLEELVYTAVGEASMCWFEIPTAVFDNELADDVAKRLIKDIEELYADK